jgi:hypothetical protein
MKQFLTLILAVLYMGSSTGASFHMHYCMGKLVEVDLLEDADAKCSKCEANHNKLCAKKCCTDEQKLVKLAKDQRATENTVQAMQLVAVAIPVSYPVLSELHAESLVEAYPVSNAPPRSSKVSPQILHCIFRI